MGSARQTGCFGARQLVTGCFFVNFEEENKHSESLEEGEARHVVGRSHDRHDRNAALGVIGHSIHKEEEVKHQTTLHSSTLHSGLLCLVFGITSNYHANRLWAHLAFRT